MVIFFGSQFSERKTRPLTLNNDAASGDRQRDDERVLHDLSGRGEQTHHRAHVFSALSCVADSQQHAVILHLRSTLFSKSSNGG